MKVKKIWADRRGALAPWAMVFLVILVVAILAIAVLSATPWDDQEDQDDDDVDGDGQPDPIWGYLQVTVDIKLNNELLQGHFTQSIEEVTYEAVEDPQTMSMLDMIVERLGLFGTDEDLALKWKITYLSGETQQSWRDTTEWNQKIGGNEIEHVDKTFATGGLRYHGAYKIEVELWDEDGIEDQWSQMVSI